MMDGKTLNALGMLGVGCIAAVLAMHAAGAQQKAKAAAPTRNDWLQYYGPPEGDAIPLDQANPAVSRIRPLAPTASTSGTMSIGTGDVLKTRVYPDAHLSLITQQGAG